MLQRPGTRTWCSALVGLALLAAILPAPGAAHARVELVVPDPLTEIKAGADVEAVSGRERVTLVGPRNGYASGQVIMRGQWAPDVSVELSPLRGAEDVIKPEHARLRFAHQVEQGFTVETGGPADPHRLAEAFTNRPYFDVLRPEPPRNASFAPLWLTVRIPADVAPGTYEGTLRVGEQSVPVRLEAGRWLCPDPAEFAMHVGLKHSPDTLARTYEVPMWSEEHFDLIRRSLERIAALGNKDLFFPAVAQTHLGNAHSMIRFRRRGDGLEPDFTILERYLDIYEAVGGRPRYLIFYLWHPGAERHQQRRGGLPVTVIEEDGSHSTERLPVAGHVGSEEAWRPVLDGIRERVLERGWDPAQKVMLGLAGDQRPAGRTVEMLAELAPYARWSIWSHFRGDPRPQDGRLELGGMEIGHYHHPYCPSGPICELGTVGGWNAGFPAFTMPRKYLYQYSPLSQYRNFAEGVLIGRWGAGGRPASGFARLLTDFWDVDDRRSLYLRYHTGNWRNMYRDGPRNILAPGPDGPVRTVRYEMLREGIQEAEARIRVEQALLEGTLPGELAERCTELLKERHRARMRDGVFSHSHAAHDDPFVSRIWGVDPEWQQLSARLFELAAEVAETSR